MFWCENNTSSLGTSRISSIQLYWTILQSLRFFILIGTYLHSAALLELHLQNLRKHLDVWNTSDLLNLSEIGMGSHTLCNFLELWENYLSGSYHGGIIIAIFRNVHTGDCRKDPTGKQILPMKLWLANAQPPWSTWRFRAWEIAKVDI